MANNLINGTMKGKTLCFHFVGLFYVCFAELGAIQLETTDF